MKVLLAVNHEGIEEYVSGLSGIDIISMVKDKKSLLSSAMTYDYELAIIANELAGDENMEDIIGALILNKSPTQRIAYLYGEWDESCDEFIKYLTSHEVYDFFIGAEVPSKIIDKLIFNPSKNMYSYTCGENKGSNKESGYYKSSKHIAKSVISMLSNQATGKSHTAWNLGYCFSKLGYDTSILNVDRGYSANLYWYIDEVYYDLLSFSIAQGKHKDILKNCCRIKNLKIITGRLGDENEIASEDFMKILYAVRTKSDITIIDTKTGISEITRNAIKNSVCDLLIFDCDVMHYHMNMIMLDKLKDEFIPEKTIAVINNTNVKSSSHKFIYNELKKTGLPFKDILPISACGQLSSEMMHTNRTPYQLKDERLKDFVKDMDNLLSGLNARSDKGRKFAGILKK